MRRLELKLGEVGEGVGAIEAPDDNGVLVSTEGARVNGGKAVFPKLPGYGTLGL